MVRRVRVRVQPRASCDEIVGVAPDGTLRVRVTAPPADGEANRGLIKLLAQAFGVPTSAVAIVAGATSREKIVEVEEKAEGNPRSP
ncbi:MAG: YggU family protein [Candidatus Latescibacteria bacterium]|nr:YggU family protein [Candidatus Latescibacterota bacterium]